MNQLVYRDKGNPEFISKLDKLNLPVVNSKYEINSQEVRSAKCFYLSYWTAYKSSHIKLYTHKEPTEKDLKHLMSRLISVSSYLLEGSHTKAPEDLSSTIIYSCEANKILDMTQESVRNVIKNQNDLIVEITNMIRDADKELGLDTFMEE